MSGEVMQFPDTVEEFMEKYKIVDTEQIYTNGMEMVPIFRMRQWFEHIGNVKPIIHGEWVDKKVVSFVQVIATCSVCDKTVSVGWNTMNYCPNCGADMRGVDDD